MSKSITGKATLTLVLTYKPDFNTGQSHPPRHHCFNFCGGGFGFVCFLLLLLKMPSHSVPMHHPIIFILHPLQRSPYCFSFWHSINQVSSVTYEKFNHFFAKGKGMFIIAQGEEWQKLSKGQLFKVVRSISFFCTKYKARTSPGTKVHTLTGDRQHQQMNLRTQRLMPDHKLFSGTIQNFTAIGNQYALPFSIHHYLDWL